MSMKKYETSNPSQLLQSDLHHLSFTPHQSTVHRAHSLSKLQSQKPTFTPEIHDLPFKVYPERIKTEVSRQQIVERLIDGKR